MRFLYGPATVFGLLALAGTWRVGTALAETPGDTVMVTPGTIQFAPGPDALPPGAQIAVLEGDPAAGGPFTMRLRLPANYEIPPHWHPIDERITVLAGALHVGAGERFDASAARELPAGSYAVLPKEMRHFAFTRQPTVIQLHGIGPWGITYVDPADDPR